MPLGVHARGLGLRQDVAGRASAGRHQNRREPGLVERDGVVEAGREDRRGRLLVVRGAEHHDGVRRSLVVGLALLPDAQRGVADDEPGAEDAEREHTNEHE
jgi:hypothetical protein